MSRFHDAGLALMTTALAAVSGCGRDEIVRCPTGGDAERGAVVVHDYGCGACHEIPGIRGARGRVAAPLTLFATRTFIDGRLPNSPNVLVRWLRNPRALDPETAMPMLGLTEQEARDAAAYLYTLD